MKRYGTLIGLLACTLTLPVSSASAQDESLAAIEGHVFDAKTLRPLQYAYVDYAVQLPSGPGGGLQAITDANGFFVLQFLPPFENPNTLQLYAVCKTRKGNARADGTLYYPIRTEIYRRDLYITLPKGITKCTP